VTLLWQCEGNNLNAGAVRFAREHWAQPRDVRDFAMRADGSATFGVVDGTRTYVATFAKGTFCTLVAVTVLA
jgi:hypothetical protein